MSKDKTKIREQEAALGFGLGFGHSVVLSSSEAQMISPESSFPTPLALLDYSGSWNGSTQLSQL